MKIEWEKFVLPEYHYLLYADFSTVNELILDGGKRSGKSDLATTLAVKMCIDNIHVEPYYLATTMLKHFETSFAQFKEIVDRISEVYPFFANFFEFNGKGNKSFGIKILYGKEKVGIRNVRFFPLDGDKMSSFKTLNSKTFLAFGICDEIMNVNDEGKSVAELNKDKYLKNENHIKTIRETLFRATPEQVRRFKLPKLFIYAFNPWNKGTFLEDKLAPLMKEFYADYDNNFKKLLDFGVIQGKFGNSILIMSNIKLTYRWNLTPQSDLDEYDNLKKIGDLSSYLVKRVGLFATPKETIFSHETIAKILVPETSIVLGAWFPVNISIDVGGSKLGSDADVMYLNMTSAEMDATSGKWLPTFNRWITAREYSFKTSENGFLSEGQRISRMWMTLLEWEKQANKGGVSIIENLIIKVDNNNSEFVYMMKEKFEIEIKKRRLISNIIVDKMNQKNEMNNRVVMRNTKANALISAGMVVIDKSCQKLLSNFPTWRMKPTDPTKIIHNKIDTKNSWEYGWLDYYDNHLFPKVSEILNIPNISY